MKEGFLESIESDAEEMLDGESSNDLIRHKAFWESQNKRLRKLHHELHSGLLLTQAHTHFVDIFIKYLFRKGIEQYEKKYKKWKYPTCMVGLGGYGRCELSPWSDVDIMLLHPQKVALDELNLFLETMNQEVVYPFWNLNLKISHAYRTINQTMEEADKDFRTKNAQLEGRFICGSESLFNLFKKSYKNYMQKEQPKDYIKHCLKHQEIRRKKYGNSVYLQEPDIKYGLGGLRDFQTLLWITQSQLGINTLEELRHKEYLSQKEYSKLQTAYDFLLKLRNELHFESNRSTNLLYLEKQPQIAWGLGYKEKDIFKRVEAFMKDYYRHAKNIYQVSNWTEERLLAMSAQQSVKFSLKELFVKRHLHKKEIDGFILLNHVLNPKSEQAFIENPIRLIRLFRYCQQFQAELSPQLCNLVQESLDLITPQIVKNPATNKSFRSILQSIGEVYPILLKMHELGVLGKFIPEFSSLTCLVQHEYYHRYTADIHTLNTIGVLDKIFTNKSKETQPYLTAMRKTTRPSLLYLVLLLHDIGKAKGMENHTSEGEALAKPILKRLGINEKQQKLVLFLIKNHLYMTQFWQRYDIDDTDCITAFADFLEDEERLHYLYTLTFCDTLGTTPDLWNSYKSMLHAHLYQKALQQLGLRKEIAEEKKVQKENQYKALLKEKHPKLTENKLQEAIALYPDRYFILTSTQDMALHIEMMDKLKKHVAKSDCRSSLMPIIDWRPDIDQGFIVVTLVTWDRPGLFGHLAGAFASVGLHILSTKAITRSDKTTLDTFYITEPYKTRNRSSMDLKASFKERLQEIIFQDKDPTPYIIAQAKAKPLSQLIHNLPAPFPTSINVQHEHSRQQTIIEIQVTDQIGLLYRLAKTISDEGFNILFARVTTEHGVALDTFHVVKKNEGEATGTSDLIVLRERLNEVLAENKELILD